MRFDTDRFEQIVEKHFGFLKQYGFQRDHYYEEWMGREYVVAYIKTQVVIVISYDIRDNYTTVGLCRASDYRPFQLSIRSALVKLLGVPEPLLTLGAPSYPEEIIAENARLLQVYGKPILEETEEFTRLLNEWVDGALSREMGLIFNVNRSHTVDCATFEQIVQKHFGFLNQYGFIKHPNLKTGEPNRTCETTFAGKHVGIRVCLCQRCVNLIRDIWDIQVSVEIVDINSGKEKEFASYLQELANISELPSVPQQDSLVETEVARWSEALRLYGEHFLTDAERALDTYYVNQKIDCDAFYKVVRKHLGFLKRYGFERRPELESNRDTQKCEVVLANNRIGIKIYLEQTFTDRLPITWRVYVGVDLLRLADQFGCNLKRYLSKLDISPYFPQVSRYGSWVEAEVARIAEILKHYEQRILGENEEVWKLAEE